ncbi:MAG TPA: dephospho-CoA kinase [Leptolyngbyaceae cyanobacterium M33_DOE_097]|uniref:Dephospho-CoA kinase n=1 Tax=Oscillatoriales cyanobacterium SpSt-418 TaxID=2282169 RepID=A0A7C3KEK6_9CYAN|nr:dephospho-CoA kinase [Leptolyngbyaceae cyanobacterium M33_DOE_097]
MTSQRRLSSPPQRIIGLTGGIGMGKTTVSNYLATSHHLAVLDADLFAREAVEPNSPILSAISERYGSGILLADGSLDRKRLGDIVFSSPAERLWLEQQIHPYVRDRLEHALHLPPLNNPALHPILVVVIPLLFEARMTDLVTETWVVQCPEAQQLDRIMQRDGLTREQAQMRLSSQMSIQKKAARADVVLDNAADLIDLYQQIDRAIAQQPAQVQG